MPKKIIMVLASLSFLQSCVSDRGTDANTWIRLTEIPQIGGLAMPECYIDGDEIFIHGGIIDKQEFSPLNSESAILNLSTNTWRHVSRNSAPKPKTMQVIAGFQNEILIFGGHDEKEDFSSDAYLYHIEKDSWIRLDASRLDPRTRHRLITIGDKAIVFGGEGAKEGLNWGYYDFSNKQWQVFQPQPSSGNRIHFVAERLAGELFVWGGFIGNKKTAKGFLLNPESQTFTALPEKGAPSPRSNAKSVSFGDRVLIWGGASSESHANSGAVFDKETFSWKTLPPIPDQQFQTLTNPSLTRVDDRFALLWGGRFGFKNFNTDAWLFDLEAWKWHRLHLKNPPSGRMLHCMIPISADELLVFGGFGQDEKGFIHYRDTYRIKIANPNHRIFHFFRW
ncbi:MAG: Kelch repeat-containing protein [Oligoflexus sp.]